MKIWRVADKQRQVCHVTDKKDKHFRPAARYIVAARPVGQISISWLRKPNQIRLLLFYGLRAARNFVQQFLEQGDRQKEFP